MVKSPSGRYHEVPLYSQITDFFYFGYTFRCLKYQNPSIKHPWNFTHQNLNYKGFLNCFWNYFRCLRCWVMSFLFVLFGVKDPVTTEIWREKGLFWPISAIFKMPKNDDLELDVSGLRRRQCQGLTTFMEQRILCLRNISEKQD